MIGTLANLRYMSTNNGTDGMVIVLSPAMAHGLCPRPYQATTHLRPTNPNTTMTITWTLFRLTILNQWRRRWGTIHARKVVKIATFRYPLSSRSLAYLQALQYRSVNPDVYASGVSCSEGMFHDDLKYKRSKHPVFYLLLNPTRYYRASGTVISRYLSSCA